MFFSKRKDEKKTEEQEITEVAGGKEIKGKKSEDMSLIDSQAKQSNILLENQKSLKDIIKPSGINSSRLNEMEVVSRTTRYARSFYISDLPRMAIFADFLRNMYNFGDINTSVFIKPLDEGKTQRDLNAIINDLESERIVAAKRGDINRESIITDKRFETEKLRDEIAAGFNKLYESTVVCTIFADSMEQLNKLSELLRMEMSKSLITIRSAWAIQEDAFKSNLPYCDNKIKKSKMFDKRTMGTVFPFVLSDISHETGIPIGFNKQTGVPVLFDNFHPSLSNYNLVVFGKSGAGKGVTIKTFTARSSVLNNIESIALDAEGEYGSVAESLGGINIVFSPTSKTVVNPFDIETEIVKDEMTGKERHVLSIENKVEDVTNVLLTMARGSTKSQVVNEITKQIIAEIIAEEYAAAGINSSPASLYEGVYEDIEGIDVSKKTKKMLPTIGSWYDRLCTKAEGNTNVDYQFHYSYLTKVMKQYIRKFGGQMAYFDGQSTFDLMEDYPFINFDISRLEEKFARPLAQQILLSWIWEKYVKKNSEDKSKARKKRVIVDEAWMLLPFPEAVDFLNTMARRARKRNVSLAVVSQKFQDFYENKNVQAVLTTSEIKLFLQQDRSEIEYLQEVFKLTDGEAIFLGTCARGEGIIKVGNETTILKIVPTEREFRFVETNLNKLAMMRSIKE
ncbi:MAG: VirB4 family type IV secretion system protein [Ignavibacteriales bacterium]